MADLVSKWSANESLLQSYRATFISSQTFLIAAGSILLDAGKPFWLLMVIAAIAFIMIWYLWFRIVVSRHRAVDYYKFQIDSTNPDIFVNCSETDYIKNRQCRNKINNALKQSNWRATRKKIDLYLPLIFTFIWFALVVARFLMKEESASPGIISQAIDSKEMSMREWIAIARDIAAIVGLPLLVWRLWLLKNTFEQDHERSRNQKAVDIIRDWTKNLNQKSSVARKLVETFDFETCKKLQDQKEFKITKDDSRGNYLKFLLDKDPVLDGDSYVVDTESSIKIRWEIVTYLNTLESVMIAYRHNVANKNILKEQFKYLVRPEDNHFILAEFRKASGTKNFPAIEEFVKELQKSINSTSEGERPTGTLL